MPSQAPDKLAPTVFRYPGPPEEGQAPKKVVRLCKSELVKADVQVLRRDGGANNLHSHTGQDGIWFVLKGRVRFYDQDDSVVADLGPNEGVLIPHDLPYWFEGTGEDRLEILHIAAGDSQLPDKRVDHRPPDQKGAANGATRSS